MRELNENGEDYSQKSGWDENANFKAESEDSADEKKEDERHFSAPKIYLPYFTILPNLTIRSIFGSTSFNLVLSWRYAGSATQNGALNCQQSRLQKAS